MSDRLVRATEVTRHLFCARALNYDRRYAGEWQTTRLKKIRRIILSWQAGISLLILVVLADFIEFPAGLILGIMLASANMLFFLIQRWRKQNAPVTINQWQARRYGKTHIAADFGLAGRIDYVMNNNKFSLPVLVKNMPAPEQPHQAHIMHIIAECLLLAEAMEIDVPYGIVKYGDGRTFEVDFDEDSVEVLSTIMDEIEYNRALADVPRNHQDRQRCYACRHRQRCDQNLFV